MKKTFVISLIAVIAIVIIAVCYSCTEQQRARGFGGTMTERLPVGQKLIMVTWKEGNDLWILTRDMRDNEFPETYTFKEKSSLGVLQGTVIISECR